MASSGSRPGLWPPCPSKHRSGASGARNSTATATTGTAEAAHSLGYIGRFAPSPSGDLHLGSLYTAVASYLDARANQGRWLVRIEDLDTPRVVPGAALRMLQTLEAFGFEWHDAPVYQSQRVDRYRAALEQLKTTRQTFECSCSRSQLADAGRYPGHCREVPAPANVTTATRLRVEPGRIQFADRIQGLFRQDVATAVGDVVLRRRDGIVAYLLAVVVDDAAQDVTHIVRGADLLDNTPRQILLQGALGLKTPVYAHVPVLVEESGIKLAKSARSVRADADRARCELHAVLSLLGLQPPSALVAASLADMWVWAIEHWAMHRIPRRLSHQLTAKIT